MLDDSVLAFPLSIFLHKFIFMDTNTHYISTFQSFPIAPIVDNISSLFCEDNVALPVCAFIELLMQKSAELGQVFPARLGDVGQLDVEVPSDCKLVWEPAAGFLRA